MAQVGKDASPGGGVVRYARHRPETTLRYRLVDEHYPAFADRMAAQGALLPEYVRREFEEYLRCGRLEHGFLRVRCETCHAEHLVAFSWPLLRIPAPAALVIPFTSQAPGLLPQLRGPAHGGERGAVGRRRPARIKLKYSPLVSSWIS